MGLLFSEDPPPTLAGLHLDLADWLGATLSRRIDLVVLDSAPVDLVHRVLRDGILLLDLNPFARIAFEARSRNDRVDLLPHLHRDRRTAPGATTHAAAESPRPGERAGTGTGP